jgi:hypothetical protein
MLFFLFDGFPLTTATLRHLAPEHRPSLNGIMDGHWTGNFTDILPYYREAYRIALAEFAEVLRDHLRKLDGLEYGTRSSLRWQWWRSRIPASVDITSIDGLLVQATMAFSGSFLYSRD